MSRSPTSTLAIGIGACDLAIGTHHSRLWHAWQRMRRGHAPASSATLPREPDAPQRGTPGADVTFAMDEALRFTEPGALEVLGRGLASVTGAPDKQRGSPRRAFIVLDDAWAHHAILRGDFRSVRTRELGDITLAYFADTFGLDAGAILTRWQLQRGGRALFASAMSRSLHDGILEVSAAAHVDVKHLTVGLPECLDQVRRGVDDHKALLLVVTETLLQVVAADHGRWAAYDAQRLFADDAADAARLVGIVDHVLERSSMRQQEDGKVYLCGLAVDPAPFQERFSGALQLPAFATADPPAVRLMGLAQ